MAVILCLFNGSVSTAEILYIYIIMSGKWMRREWLHIHVVRAHKGLTTTATTLVVDMILPYASSSSSHPHNRFPKIHFRQNLVL